MPIGAPELERQPFYCPYPGCKRKFASLWRLKVHYRAPPNERGSGKERGHGVELPICPACNEQLEPGKHHNKCKAGRTTNPPSKRAPKASTAGNRSTKSTRHAVVTKRLVAWEPSGVDATCTPRNDTDHDSMGAPPSDTARCAPVTRIDDMEVAQGTFMMPQLFSCHPQGAPAGPQQQAVHGFPTFDYNYAPSAEDDGLHDSGPSSHEMGHSHADEAHADTFAMPLSAAQQLSAQGAAKVLYTIARSDAEPMAGNGSDSVALATAYPHYALSPISGASRGNDDEADDAMHTGAHMDSDLLHSPGSPGALGSEPIAHSVLVPGQTADGVPVETLNSNMPMLYPWSDGQGQSGMQLVMSPHGFIPTNGRSQFFIPVQTIKGPGGEEMTVVMPQEACCMQNGYNMVVAPDASVGAPVLLSGDGMPQYVSEGQPMCMPILQVSEGRSMCNAAAAQSGGGVPLYGNGGISEEDFLRAIRMASATEVSATS